MTAAGAREREPRTVRRPDRRAVGFLPGRDLARGATVGGGEPHRAAVAVGVEVDAADDVGDCRAVRRDRRLLDADKAGDV